MAHSGKKAIQSLIRWLAVSIACWSTPALADVPEYELYDKDSTLSFIATQNNAPVKGSFKAFDAEIHFDPDNLEESHIRVTVDIDSLTMADLDVLKILKSATWFDVGQHPKAVFESTRIQAADTSADYIAEGKLTLKNATQPLTLYFHMERMDDQMAVANGYAVLMRNGFEVGTGEWADDSTVKNEVRVEFYIIAQRKP